MTGIGDHRAAVVEPHSITAVVGEDRRGVRDPAGPALLVEHLVAHGQGAHGRPPLRRRDRRVQGERLAHGGPCPDDRQTGRLQPGQDLVEVGVAGGHAGDPAAALGQLLDPVQAGQEEVLQRLDGIGRPPLRQVEDLAFGFVDRAGHVLGYRVADLGDLSGYPDEPPEQGVLFDDTGVVHRIGDRRRVRLERDEQGRIGHDVEQGRSAQLIGHGDRVDRLAPFEQVDDRPEDAAVGRLVEVGRRTISTAAAVASLDSSIAPRRDSSASRLWGGTRGPPPAPPPSGAGRRWRGRSSKAWTMV